MSFFVKHVDTNFVNFMIMVGKKNLLIAIYSLFIEYTYWCLKKSFTFNIFFEIIQNVHKPTTLTQYGI